MCSCFRALKTSLAAAYWTFCSLLRSWFGQPDSRELQSSSFDRTKTQTRVFVTSVVKWRWVKQQQQQQQQNPDTGRWRQSHKVEKDYCKWVWNSVLQPCAKRRSYKKEKYPLPPAPWPAVISKIVPHLWGGSKGVINFPWIFRQCGSTSFPWLVFFFGALLWGSIGLCQTLTITSQPWARGNFTKVISSLPQMF